MITLCTPALHLIGVGVVISVILVVIFFTTLKPNTNENHDDGLS